MPNKIYTNEDLKKYALPQQSVLDTALPTYNLINQQALDLSNTLGSLVQQYMDTLNSSDINSLIRGKRLRSLLRTLTPAYTGALQTASTTPFNRARTLNTLLTNKGLQQLIEGSPSLTSFFDQVSALADKHFGENKPPIDLSPAHDTITHETPSTPKAQSNKTFEERLNDFYNKDVLVNRPSAPWTYKALALPLSPIYNALGQYYYGADLPPLSTELYRGGEALVNSLFNLGNYIGKETKNWWEGL